MAYITAKDLRAVVPDEYRDAALSDSGSTPEPGLLQAVIGAACEEVDSLIEGRVNLPLAEPYPKKVKTASLYIALSILFVRRGIAMPQDMADTVTFWRTRMGKVGAGDLRVEAPAAETESAATLSTRGSIVVRPIVTGTGGLIGAFLLLLSSFCPSARAVDARTFSFTAPTNPMIESPDFMEWSQAESVGLRYRLAAADATREARWEISDPTNLWLNLEPTRSGTLWIWNPAPTQTCLPAGRYVGRVAVYDRTGTNLTFHRILAFQDIRVHAARDPSTLILASPLASICTGQPIYVEVDAAALGALGSHEGATNPHSITPALIGAATGQPIYVEVDASALAALDETNIPVSCLGGYYFPDYFTLETRPYSYVATSLGSTTTVANTMACLRYYSGENGLILDSDIVRQDDWSSAVSYSDMINLQILDTNGFTVAAWLPGTTSGTVGSLMANLGEFSLSASVTFTNENAYSNWWWTADAPGTLRATVNTSILARAARTNASASVYLAGAYSQTNFVRDTNFWAAGIDFTCASPWNSAGKQFYAGTLVTPQHFVSAAHFMAPTGAIMRFIDSTNGVHDAIIAKQKKLHDDLAIGVLASEIPASVRPALIMDPSDIGRFRGHAGMENDPGWRVVVFDQAESAFLASTKLDNGTGVFNVYHSIRQATGAFSRVSAIGGDSGNPIFLVVGTNTILLATQSSAYSGAGMAYHLEEINSAIVELGGSAYTSAASAWGNWTDYDAPNLE